LRRAVGCGAVVLLGGGGVAILAPGTGAAQYSGADVEILNFALGLERLQAAFYARAVDGGAIDGDPLEFARVAAEHEAAHVEALVAILGADAADEPELDFGDATSSAEAFLTAAVALEDLGVAAYNGQAANLSARALATTAGIASVDARHAAWIRSLAGKNPAAKPVDAGRPAPEIEAAVAATGFVVQP
jgi:Ferritin-like domain